MGAVLRDNLDPSLKLVFGSEGGYWNDPAGGPTKFGITLRTLAAYRGKPTTEADVRVLTLAEAADIYRAGYWTQSGGDILPAGVDYAVFDFGVNSGPAHAVKALQVLLGVKADGNCGPETAAAARAYPGGSTALIADYCAARLVFLKSLKNPKKGWPVNGRGWQTRVDRVEADAKALALAPAASADPAPVPMPAPSPAVVAAADPSPKAPPPAPPSPWVQPEATLGVISALGGLSFLFTGSGPVQLAVGAAIGVASLCGAAWFIRRMVRAA